MADEEKRWLLANTGLVLHYPRHTRLSGCGRILNPVRTDIHDAAYGADKYRSCKNCIRYFETHFPEGK